jgi:hypothetical protein
MSITIFYLVIASLQIICPLVRINGEEASIAKGEAPILDFVTETNGYTGQINEQNVLVDLNPHLEIKNIDSISKYFIQQLIVSTEF